MHLNLPLLVIVVPFRLVPFCRSLLVFLEDFWQNDRSRFKNLFLLLPYKAWHAPSFFSELIFTACNNHVLFPRSLLASGSFLSKDQSPFRAFSCCSPWKIGGVHAQPNPKMSGVEFKWETRQTTACAAQVSLICLLNPAKWRGFHPHCSSSLCFIRQMVVKC